MSLSEHDRQVLAELEDDLGPLSAATRLYLLIRAPRTAWHGLLLPAVALAMGAGLLAAGALVGAMAGEVMIVAGITAISYAAAIVCLGPGGPAPSSPTQSGPPKAT